MSVYDNLTFFNARPPSVTQVLAVHLVPLTPNL